MRFKTDENLPFELARLLHEKGHDALTVWDQGLRGKPDATIAEVCQREKRVLLTLDTGFADIRSYPPEQYSGIIVLRPAQQNRKQLTGIVERLLPFLNQEPLVGKLWIVDENNLRVFDEKN